MMKNPAMIVPGAMEALQALAESAVQTDVSQRTRGLVHLRASQINGCSVCVDMSFPSEKQVRQTSAFLPACGRGWVGGDCSNQAERVN